jgi:hypothetical protein
MTGGPSGSRVLVVVAFGLSSFACNGADFDTSEDMQDAQAVEQVEAAVWAFHAADTSRNADGVIDLLWPEFTMLADGRRLTYPEVAAGSREFMATLESFNTRDGEVNRAHGPTKFVWQRRAGEWRVLFADADHYRDGP